MEKSKKNKIICPTCKGNGYVRIPYRLTEEEITAQCGVCDSEGEINYKSKKFFYKINVEKLVLQ